MLLLETISKAGTFYVNATGGNDASNGLTWASAKETIQAAVDAASASDTVYVADGVYSNGSRVAPGQVLCKSRVVINKALTIQSQNGPSNTFIVGQGPAGDTAIRCVWMTNRVVLAGFTLTNGFTTLLGSGFQIEDNGGGVWCRSTNAVVTNCVFVGNMANAGGGGAYNGTLYNCTLSSNTASSGGGAAYATLNNCTLSGNTAYYGGGAGAGTLNNCTLSGNRAVFYGGGADGGTLNNCTLSGNTADTGGGARSATLNNCTLSGNSATGVYGGGAYNATLNNCTLSGNTAGTYGGGAADGTLNNCTLSSNTATIGGGAISGTLKNCTLSGNTAYYGGGAYNATLNNCTLSGNTATSYGGGAYNATLNNCTLSGNRAVYYGGGADNATLNNCTVVGNSSSNGAGLTGGSARNSIIYGNAGVAVSNILLTVCYTNDPSFVSPVSGNYRLQSTSPCINVGINALAPTNVTPFDLDGNPRIYGGTVDLGAYEYQGFDFADLYASAGLHGSIVPSGTVRTNLGANVQFTMQPAPYYEVAVVTTNGVGIGTPTNFVWQNVLSSGTITVAFAASATTNGTPHWWLASYGWTQDYAAVELLDPDGDGLKTWREFDAGTNPTNANSDGDQFNDGVEVNAGANPLKDDSQVYAAILANPSAFALYTSNSVFDLSFGKLMLAVHSNTVHVQLGMQATADLGGSGWSNVGSTVEWQYPAPTNKAFFRFYGGP